MNKPNAINTQKETIKRETEKGEKDKNDTNESRFITITINVNSPDSSVKRQRW